jgi:hypothetical protein
MLNHHPLEGLIGLIITSMPAKAAPSTPPKSIGSDHRVQALD